MDDPTWVDTDSEEGVVGGNESLFSWRGASVVSLDEPSKLAGVAGVESPAGAAEAEAAVVVATGGWATPLGETKASAIACCENVEGLRRS